MKKLKKSLGLSFGLAGASIGMGMMGESLGSQGLKDAGETTSGFISPMVNIGMGGMMIDQLRNLNPKKKKD